MRVIKVRTEVLDVFEFLVGGSIRPLFLFVEYSL